eukprot:TRINITY_DN5660_c0_g2_i1.p1 TRINITY_DN5660_c0_g2~~TRINITY_DN5660_c0_g2_i1.p1  ORF type:complete len:880 (+),score=260.52 TRINITY_DN5660_c0_g2_i1:61-2700(+)
MLHLDSSQDFGKDIELTPLDEGQDENEHAGIMPKVEALGLYLDDEVGLWPQIGVLRFDIEKARAYRVLPLYLFLLATITSIPWMSRLSNERYNELYHLESANRRELFTNQFLNVSDVDTFWDWYSELAVAVFSLDNGHGNSRMSKNQNFPIGYLLLRQFRVKPGACVVPSIIQGTMHLSFPDECYGEWDIDMMSKDAYGAPNWVHGSELDVLSVNTMFHTYPSSEDAFTITFPLSQSQADASSNVSFLKLNNWIDSATRCVIIDVLTFNPSIDAFALNHFYIEFFATGSVVANLKAYPFEILHMTSHDFRYLFVADVIMVLLTAQLAIGLIVTIYRRRQMNYAVWLGLYDAYDVMFIVILIHACYYRMVLWRDGPDLHDGQPPADDKEMYTLLFNYGFRYERANTYVGIAVVFAWVRLFRFLQYNGRLGVLSETLYKAKADLIAMLMILIIVLVGYGIGGSALYGVDHQNFSSWWIAMAYLLRLLISAEVDQYYDELKAIHPNWTGFYMATFMIITWMIILNMVLAIITGAFVSVQENNKTQVEGWSPRQLKKDFINYVDRLPVPFCKMRNHDYCEKRLGVLLLLLKMSGAKKNNEEDTKKKMMTITLREWLDTSREYIDAELALKLFMRGKLRTRDPDGGKNVARSVNSLSAKIDHMQTTMYRVGVKLDKAGHQQQDNSSNNTREAPPPMVSIATQTGDIPPPPPPPPMHMPISVRQASPKAGRNDKTNPYLTRRRGTEPVLKEYWPDSEDGDVATPKKAKPKRQGSYTVHENQCKSLGCTATREAEGSYCYHHMCPNCTGLKPTKHQPLCAQCELSPGNVRRDFKQVLGRRLSQDSQGFPSTRRPPQDSTSFTNSTNGSFTEHANHSSPLLPYNGYR